MIYITGDTHGYPERFSFGNIPDGEWTENDYLIICGDFGYIWWGDEHPREKETDRQNLDFIAQKPYTVLFIDGNHENFDELYKYPTEERFGGPVRRIRDNIFHLERGYIYKIENKTFFTFGGAYSPDKARRVKGLSWWRQEQPTKAERERGLAALDAAGGVDYIITHTAPFSAVEKMKYFLPYAERRGFEIDNHDFELMNYFETIANNYTFNHWYFGHWHRDIKIDNRFTAVTTKFYRVE